MSSSEVNVRSFSGFGELRSRCIAARIARNVARIADGIARIATGVATAGEETIEESLHITTGFVEQTAEFPTATGVATVARFATEVVARAATGVTATVTRTATDFVARIATVVAATVARTATGVTSSARIAATIAATSELEAFEKFLELELGTATGVTTEIVARTAIGIASSARIATEVVARTAIATNGIARIATLVGEESLQPFSKRELGTATGVATEIATTVTRTTIDDVARRTCHDTVAGTAFAHRTRLAGDQVLETGEQIARLGTTVARTARIAGRIARSAIACESPGAHQQGEDESGHHNSGLHWVNSPFPGLVLGENVVCFNYKPLLKDSLLQNRFYETRYR